MFKKLSTLFFAGVILFGLTACDPFEIVKDWGVALQEWVSGGSETDGDEMQFDEDGNLIIPPDAEGVNWDSEDDEGWTLDPDDFNEAMDAITAAQEAESQEEEEVDIANFAATSYEECDDGEDEFKDSFKDCIVIDDEEEEEEWEPPVFESGTYGLIGTMYIDSAGDPAFDSYMKCLDGVNKTYVHHYDYCDATWGPFDVDIADMHLGEMLECMNSDPDFREAADNCWLNYTGEWGVGIGGE